MEKQMIIKPRRFDTKVVKLDSIENYITVKVINKDGKVLYTLKKARMSDEELKISDFETAKLLASKILANKEVKYLFHIDGKDFDASNAQKIAGYFQLYDIKEGIKYYIEETYNYNLYKTGYFVFQDGSVQRYDREYGLQFMKEEIEVIKCALQNELTAIDSKILTIDEVSKTKFILNLKDSTAKIVICANSDFMDTNQQLKAAGAARVIPYLKNMDKYLTICVYSMVDRIYDKWFINSKGMVDSTIDNMVEFINETQYEQYNTQYVETPFTGYVNLEKCNL